MEQPREQYSNGRLDKAFRQNAISELESLHILTRPWFRARVAWVDGGVPMIGKTVGHYQITGKLGEGGLWMFEGF